jgi:hypothetical protein
MKNSRIFDNTDGTANEPATHRDETTSTGRAQGAAEPVNNGCRSPLWGDADERRQTAQAEQSAHFGNQWG